VVRGVRAATPGHAQVGQQGHGAPHAAAALSDLAEAISRHPDGWSEASRATAPQACKSMRRRAIRLPCYCLLLTARPARSFSGPDVASTYQNWLHTAPLLTKAATSSFFFAAGDTLAQAIDEETDEVSFGRVARFAGTGFGNGIAWSCWYGVADELLQPVDLPALRVVSAMAIEQFVWCPILFAVYIIPLSSILNGAPAAELPGEVRKRLGPLLIANAKVWTPANLIIYNVPVEYRVLASNGIDLVWAVICSQTAAECGSDDGCLVSTSNVVLGDDGCALPLYADDERLPADGAPVTVKLVEEPESVER